MEHELSICDPSVQTKWIWADAVPVRWNQPQWSTAPKHRSRLDWVASGSECEHALVTAATAGRQLTAVHTVQWSSQSYNMNHHQNTITGRFNPRMSIMNVYSMELIKGIKINKYTARVWSSSWNSFASLYAHLRPVPNGAQCASAVMWTCDDCSKRVC